MAQALSESEAAACAALLERVKTLGKVGGAAARAAALERGVRREVARGTELVREGQTGSPLFLLLSGACVGTCGGVPAHEWSAPARFGERTWLRADEACGAGVVVSSEDCVVVEIGHAALAAAIAPHCASAAVGGRTLLGRRVGPDVAAFWGVRFARAARLEPPAAWSPAASGTPLACLTHGPVCPQVDGSALVDQLPAAAKAMMPAARSLPHDLLFLPCERHAGTLVGADRLPMTEDCLSLSVTAPARAVGGSAALPVMVWIHGGAFVQGAGSVPIYDGAHLARRGAVVVSINYRLGALGFLLAEGVPSNLGLQDQLAALQWVRRHIGAFGGDAANVTVFGESAGAMSVGCLLGSPLRAQLGGGGAGPLFRRAILQSGAADNVHSEAQARETARRLLAALGGGGGGSPEAAAVRLRTAPLLELLAASKKVGMEGFSRADLYGKAMAFAPAVLCSAPHADPVFRGVPPMQAIATGIARDVQVLLGTTKDEFALFMLGGGPANSAFRRSGGDAGMLVELAAARVAQWLAEPGRARVVPDAPQRARRIAQSVARDLGIPAGPGAKASKKQAQLLLERLYSAWVFELPCLRLAELQSHHNDVYAYRMDFEAKAMNLRACHALELPFVFGTHGNQALAMLLGGGDEIAPLSEKMQASWVSFAATGRPDAPAAWPRWTQLNNPVAKAFGVDEEGNAATRVVAMPMPHVANLWDGISIARL
jgi:para-nitrobenzyl esterase